MLRTASKKRTKRRGKDRFEPRKTKVNGEIYWQVNLPRELVTLDDGRQVWKQKRRTLRDHEEAKTVAEQARVQWKNSGLSAFAIPDRVRSDALAAAKLLEPFGVTILSAAEFYTKHLKAERTSEKVSVVVKEFLSAKENDNLRPRYLKDLRIRLNRFGESFGQRTVAGISAGEIDKWLRGFKPFNRNTFRLRVSALFSYALKCKWCQDNPVEEVEKVKASATIGILTPEQFSKVLEASSEETLPYWLLGGFAGLRRAEIERLEWKDVHFDLAKYRAFTQAVASGNKEAIAKAEKEWRSSALIEVPALKAKTASRRFVQIQDNFAAWLEPYIGRNGEVCPLGLRKRLEADRTAAGLSSWPSNALRHGFASYHLAHFKDSAKLALELGHTDQELLFRHYRELVKPDQAAQYWDIRPEAETQLVAISA